MEAFGRHLLLDFENCKNLPDDIQVIRNILTAAVGSTGATIVDEVFKKFEPQGLTGVLVLSESHLSIHTYPENGFVYLDLFTCGDHCEPLRALSILVDFFQPEKYTKQYIIRSSESARIMV